jgi:hypothetical protein
MMRPSRKPMTTAELKRHLDRRFDRLDRTKADKREMNRRFDRVDRDFRRYTIEIKRHFDVIAERLEEKIAQIAEVVGSEITKLKQRVDHHDVVLDEHETRITAIERRA